MLILGRAVAALLMKFRWTSKGACHLFANISSYLEMKLLILTLNMYLDIVVICYLLLACSTF